MANIKQLRESHWDNLFKTRDYTQVLWHQNSPKFSLDLIQDNLPNKDASIIDVGCGASLLVDSLIDSGYKNIKLLDVSATSQEIVKNRLGSKADIPKYICSDIMNFKTSQKFDIWHDRALFHFLLLKKERAKYFEVLKDSLKPEGVAIINTFAIDGPTECAGLQITQYDDKKMLQELPVGLELIKCKEYMHDTPKDTKQEYNLFVIKKT